MIGRARIQEQRSSLTDDRVHLGISIEYNRWGFSPNAALRKAEISAYHLLTNEVPRTYVVRRVLGDIAHT